MAVQVIIIMKVTTYLKNAFRQNFESLKFAVILLPVMVKRLLEPPGHSQRIDVQVPEI